MTTNEDTTRAGEDVPARWERTSARLDALLDGAAVRPGNGTGVTAADRARLEAALADHRAAPPDDDGPTVRETLTAPSRARIRDLLLGGKDHYAVDRLAAAELATAWPDIAHAAAELRAAVHAAARHAVGVLGVRQVLVTDYGYPTASTSGPDLHTTVHHASPSATVVYLEPDPVAAATLRAYAERPARPGHGAVAVVRADLAADPGAAFARAVGDGGLDPGRPVCVLLPEALARSGDPGRIARLLAHVLAPGSPLLAAAPPDLPHVRHAAEAAARHLLPFHPRTTAELRGLLTDAGLTCPEHDPLRPGGACAVAARTPDGDG
ncbi:SAM-dependent methyltransferase [Streptomyces avicenniae]|uniref:SAM-dependent methyltransferase n=1 Tax=Streptomyces avicenniae TaxID=500153 RepID=UPI00069946C6|nr:SAM-dependent methyltransferase [Streptomyces avicenniae]